MANFLCCLQRTGRLGRASRWRKSKTRRSASSPQIHQKYIYMWNNSYRTPPERWQKTSDFPKGKKLPTYLGRAKAKRKNRDKRIGMDLHQWEGAVKEERFPHTRKALRGRRLRVVEGGKLRSHGGGRSHRGAEGKAERFPHGGSVPTSTHQPERLVCSPAGAGGAGS